MAPFAAIIVAVLLVGTARAHARHTHAVGRPRGAAAGLEGVMLYLRNEIYMPVIGHGGEKYVPFCLTLFFFIAVANLLGLVPYGSTATGNQWRECRLGIVLRRAINCL